MRKEKGQQVTSTLFHELGHALYYAFAPPESALVLDGRIGREMLAELWACLMETPEWLESFASFPKEEADTFLDTLKKRAICNSLSCLRETLFEIELYQDPDADFRQVWRRITNECLGFEDQTPMYSEFVFLYPMDVKDYVYTRWIAENLCAKLKILWCAPRKLYHVL